MGIRQEARCGVAVVRAYKFEKIDVIQVVFVEFIPKTCLVVVFVIVHLTW